jgi:hypothetical protein
MVNSFVYKCPELSNYRSIHDFEFFFCRDSGFVQVCRAICPKDEGRPLGAAFQEEASNHPELLWLRAMVMSVREKA